MPQFLFLSPDEIVGEFRDGEARNAGDSLLDTGVTIEEAVQGLLDGTLEANNIPMVEVERQSGQWFCVDYRPLAVFQKLHKMGQCQNIKVKVVPRRAKGQDEIADEFPELKITVGEKGKRKVKVQPGQGNPVAQTTSKTTPGTSSSSGRKAADDSMVQNKTERPTTSLGRNHLTKSLPSKQRNMTVAAHSAKRISSSATRRELHQVKSIDTSTPNGRVGMPNGRIGTPNSRLGTGTPNGRVGVGTPNGRISSPATSLTRREIHQMRSIDTGTPNGRSMNHANLGTSNHVTVSRQGTSRTESKLPSFVRSGSGRGASLPSTARTKSATAPGRSTTVTNATSSRLGSASSARSGGAGSGDRGGNVGSSDRKQETPKSTGMSGKQVIHNSHSSTSTNSSNGPDEPRTLSEWELMQGSESDDEMLFVFDGHGNNQRLPIDMLAETDRDLRTLNHRCWTCRKFFQSKQELWIHKQQHGH